jgi:signal transduction histidine kinase/ligand-binding sensor domain-containing protein
MFPRLKSMVTALILLAGVPLQIHGSATAEQYLTDFWTADNGLPNSSVTAIAQTRDGYLWIGTYNGLARFDGVRFVVFDPANTPALAHARVRQLFVDNAGTLWINTYDGSLTSFHDGKFTRAWTGRNEIDPDFTMLSSGSNQIVFLSHRGYLLRQPLAAIEKTNWEELMPMNHAIGAIGASDAAGNIFYRNADRHLLRLAGDDFLSADADLADPRVNCLTTDATGKLWVGTDHEIAIWKRNHFENVTPTNSTSPLDCTFLFAGADENFWAVANGKVFSGANRRWLVEAKSLRDFFTGNLSRLGALADHHGGIWLYDYGRGLFHVNADGEAKHFSAENNFPGDRVNCFFEDHEGNWWAGLDAGGLVRIRERRFQTIGSNEENLKPAKSVCEDQNGTVWIGTLGDGLASRAVNGAVTNFPVPGGFAFSVCAGGGGKFWISAGAEDLYQRAGNEFKRVTPPVHGVKVLFAEKNGRVWAGTKSGLFFSDDGSSFVNFEDVGRNDFRALAADGRGNLWAGTADGTLFCITNDFVMTFHTAPTNAIPAAIWSLLAQTNGTVWIGTFRGGLLRWRDGKFSRYEKSDGLPDDVICQILDDGGGNLWLGSYRGIACVAKSALENFSRGEGKQIACTIYGRADGLPSLECSGGYQPAAWRGDDGKLWFTTLRGAVSIQPQNLKLNLLPPPVVIEEILVDGKKITPEKDFIEVPPGKHQFEFDYTGISLIASEQVAFRYQLEGADADWINTATRSATYNYLPPGDYVFHVIAANSDGIWNKTGARLKIKILPHFYETWWFRILAGIFLIASVVGILRYTTIRRLQVKMQRLERQHAIERERTRIAKDIHDDLGASLTLIAVLGDLAQKEKSDERIEKMSVTARQAVKSLDEIVWAVNPRNDTLAHLVDYAGQFAMSYLRAVDIRCLLDVPDRLPAREVSTEIRHNIFLAIKEALQNIVKHSRATEVWLRVVSNEKFLKIAIEDNGCGFANEPENSTADGLRNMRQRLKEIGGECKIESLTGAGTTVFFELPWREHFAAHTFIR